MARRQRIDHGLGSRLDKFEAKMQYLKIAYEKYFSGIDRMEPASERDELRRVVRELQRQHYPNLVQRHRFQMLRARFISMDNYLNRNLFMIERGTHPRFRFRADLADRRRGMQNRVSAFERQRIREEQAYKSVFEKYVEARRACGQSGDLDFARVRGALAKQVRMIKSRYKCDSVRFRIQVEGGRARLKAVPLRHVRSASSTGS